MILDKEHLNTAGYLHLEHYVNDGSPSGFSEKFTTSPGTRPGDSPNGFHLCAIEIPGKVEIEDLGCRPAFFDRWQMLVHPDMIGDPIFSICSKIDRQSIAVSPTASCRTVKMLTEPGWFLKLCYKGL